MFDSYNFTENGNSSLAEAEIPQLKPEEVMWAQTRLKKLASVEDFQIRWGLKERKDAKAKEMKFRESSAESNFESGKQFAIFENDFEEFIHPEWYWEADDGEWDGLYEDTIGESWYGDILNEIFLATEKISPEILQMITENQIHDFCYNLNHDLALKNSNRSTTWQIKSIPETFPTTLWADVIEFTRLYIQLEKTGQVPELSLGREEFLDFSEGGFRQKPYNPLQEFVSRWDPEKNFYYDECSRVRTGEFAKRMRPVQETHVRESGGNYITHITKKSLYQALRWDLADFLQEKARSGLGWRAKRETREYFRSEQLVFSIMKKVEDAFRNYHGPDRVEFIGGVQLSEEEKTRIETIQSVRGPVDGDMG